MANKQINLYPISIYFLALGLISAILLVITDFIYFAYGALVGIMIFTGSIILVWGHYGKSNVKRR